MEFATIGITAARRLQAITTTDELGGRKWATNNSGKCGDSALRTGEGGRWKVLHHLRKRQLASKALFMFDQVPDKGLWLPSFLLQQVLATFVCPIVASVIALPMFAAGWIGYFFMLGVPAFIGFKVERSRTWAIRAGKWVWVLPLLSVALNVHDYASHESLGMALRYTFWPGSESGEKGIGWVLLTLPACASVGYVIGLALGARENPSERRAQ